MNDESNANKNELTFDFHKEVHQDLLEDFSDTMVFKKNKIIRFPRIYRKLGTKWHLRKRQTFKVLKDLERMGLIEIVAFHGIRIIS